MNDKLIRQLQEIYLDFWNNFLTIERFQEYYNYSSIEEAQLAIRLGKEAHESIVKYNRQNARKVKEN